VSPADSTFGAVELRVKSGPDNYLTESSVKYVVYICYIMYSIQVYFPSGTIG